MAQIGDYEKDNTLEDGDKWIGTDVTGGDTKNYTLLDVRNFIVDSLPPPATGVVPGGVEGDVQFNVSGAFGAVSGINYNSTSDRLSISSTLKTQPIALSAPYVTHDFESGALPPFTTDGDVVWFATNSTAGSGTFSAQSGAIADSQVSNIEVAITVVDNFTVSSFQYKVSTESGADFLEFYINGVLQQKFSGEVDWTTSDLFYLPNGVNTLKWVYSKSASGSAGSDTVWIDTVLANNFQSSLQTEGISYLDGDLIFKGRTIFTNDVVGGLNVVGDITIDGTSITTDITDLQSGKVDKVAGKELSENDYVDADKAKVDNTPADTITELAGKVSLTGDNVMAVASTLTVADAIVDAPYVSYGFESGDLTGFTTSGNAVWFATNAASHSGTWSAQSGVIGNSEFSSLQKSEIVSQAFTVIQFAVETSTEGDGFDPMDFYINGFLQDSFSGISGGFVLSSYYIIPQGTNTLEWIYSRDGGGGGGSDFVRIDTIDLSTYTPGLTANSLAHLKDAVLDGNTLLSGKFIGQPVFNSDIAIKALGVPDSFRFYIGPLGGLLNTRVGVNAMGAMINDPANSRNTGVGNFSAPAFTDGLGNSFYGDTAGRDFTAGDYNQFVGGQAGRNLVTGDRNQFYGRLSGKGITSGDDNIMIGSFGEADANVFTGVVNGVFSVNIRTNHLMSIDTVTGTHLLPILDTASINLGGAQSMITKGYADDFVGNPEFSNILSEANLEPLELATDGVMRHPIDYEVFTKMSQDEITIANPFWIKPSTTRKKVVIGSHDLSFKLTYTGTDSLFYGVDVSGLSFMSIDIVFSNSGTKFLDLNGDFINNPLSSPVLLANGLTVNGCDMGHINGFLGLQVMNFTAVAITDGLEINNAIVGLEIRDSTITGNTSISNAYFRFTGTIGNIFINNLSIAGLASGESLIALDSGLVTDSISIDRAPFLATAGSNFFQPDLTGSITLYQNLAALITGSGTAYVDDGNGNVKVTTTSTSDLYIGLTLTISATTNYNGNFQITKILSTTEFVINDAYVSDEVSGSHVGNGTRVTSAAHGITDYRTNTISATTNYNGVFVVRNTTTNTFDIDFTFVADDATGSFIVTSLDQTNVKVSARDNGALPDSQKVAQVYMSTFIVVTIATTVFTKIGGTNWVEQISEEFTTDNTGRATYNGINPKSFSIRIDGEIGKVGGGTDQIEMRAAVNDVTLPASRASTTATVSDSVSGEAVVTLQPGDYVELWVTNQTNGSNVEVEFASMVVK